MFRLQDSTANVLPLFPSAEAALLMARLESVIQMLDGSLSIELHRALDQSYYMQKLSELSLLREQYLTTANRLLEIDRRLSDACTSVNGRLQADVSQSPKHLLESSGLAALK